MAEVLHPTGLEPQLPKPHKNTVKYLAAIGSVAVAIGGGIVLFSKSEETSAPSNSPGLSPDNTGGEATPISGDNSAAQAACAQAEAEAEASTDSNIIGGYITYEDPTTGETLSTTC